MNKNLKISCLFVSLITLICWTTLNAYRENDSANFPEHYRGNITDQSKLLESNLTFTLLNDGPGECRLYGYTLMRKSLPGTVKVYADPGLLMLNPWDDIEVTLQISHHPYWIAPFDVILFLYTKEKDSDSFNRSYIILSMRNRYYLMKHNTWKKMRDNNDNFRFNDNIPNTFFSFIMYSPYIQSNPILELDQKYNEGFRIAWLTLKPDRTFSFLEDASSQLVNVGSDERYPKKTTSVTLGILAPELDKFLTRNYISDDELARPPKRLVNVKNFGK